MGRLRSKGDARTGTLAASNANGTALRSGAELLREMACGDRRALSELYDRLAGSAFSLAWRLLDSRHEAEDVVYDVFLECWREATRYDPARNSVRTWILLRIRAHALDRLRGRRSASGFRSARSSRT